MPRLLVMSDLHIEFGDLELQDVDVDVLVLAGDIHVGNLEEFVATSGAALWIHGHHHHSCDYTVGTTRVVSNPRGYAGYEPNSNFDPGLVVGVDDPHTGQNRH